MGSYCLKFKIRPILNDAHPHSIAGAYAVVYVFCDKEESAKAMAVHHLEQHQWKVLNLESVSEMTPALLSQLHETQVAGYREAKTTGIFFAILDAWPNFLNPIFDPSSSTPFYTNCRHWMFPSCPQRNNEAMAKTEPHQPPVHYMGSRDVEEINKLCAACPKFEEDS